MLKIAVIGHSRIIKPITSSIEKSFEGIEIVKIEFLDMEMKNAAIEYLKASLYNLDGIIFTGKTPYTIVNSEMPILLPQVYIRQDTSMLLQALMEAAAAQKRDITKISCDSYSKEEVIRAYAGFALKCREEDVFAAPPDISGSTEIQDIYKFHKKNYIDKNANICVTGISKVYEKLNSENIPCFLLRPTSESVANSVIELMGKINAVESAESQIVVISMEIDLPGEYNLVHENEYQLMLEKTRVTEQVYRFAQRIQAAVVEVGIHNYLLFSTRKIFESVTSNSLKLPLLKEVTKNSVHTLSVGVGYGQTARQARYNASIGLNRALSKGGNQAFIVENGDFSNAIYPEEEKDEFNKIISNPLFTVISEETGLSVNKIYKLHCIIQKTKKDCFTSYELAQELGTTRRSINRIIEKLESAGYAKVEGKRMMTETGRPSRIIKLLLKDN